MYYKYDFFFKEKDMYVTTIGNHCCRQLQLMVLVVSHGRTQAGRCSGLPVGNTAFILWEPSPWMVLSCKKSHHICILPSINFLSLLVSFMTLWFILSAITDLFYFPPKSDWHFCEDLRVEGAIEGVGHHPKSEVREDCHWTLKMSNSILTEAPLCTKLSF